MRIAHVWVLATGPRWCFWRASSPWSQPQVDTFYIWGTRVVLLTIMGLGGTGDLFCAGSEKEDLNFEPQCKFLRRTVCEFSCLVTHCMAHPLRTLPLRHSGPVGLPL